MFYVVMALVNPGITVKDVQDILGPLVVSFYRIAPNVWIIYAPPNRAKDISDRLQPVCSPGGRVFVSQLDLNDRWGWLDKATWEWMKTHGGP
jgi:hypothetical protein